MLNEALSLVAPVQIGASIWIGETKLRQILSLEITQRHADHNRLKLRFYHDQVQNEGSMSFDGAEKLLGQVAEITLYDRNASDKELNNLFVVTKVSFEHNALNEGIINLEAISPTGVIDAGPHYESFYRQNLATIAKTVCVPLEKVKAGIQANPTITEPFSFICRYGESSWNFLKRLSAETGQWLYFNGKALIFGEPESVQGRDLVYGRNCSRINMQMQARPVTAGYFDYESTANESLTQSSNSDIRVNHTDRGHAFSKSKAVFGTDSYRYPQSLPPGSDTISKIGSAKAMMQSADMYVLSGESTLQELRVGMLANLEMIRFGNHVSHTAIRIISVTHTLDATGHYSNTFEAINAQSPVPPAIHYRHPLTGTIPAEVISNDDESGQGRVQVKFLGWTQEHSIQQTDWIRVLAPDAGSSGVVGQNRGYVFIPEPGDQVMVAFENNNPDRPYVQGSVFHGGNGAGGGANNHTKSIITRSGHTIEMDDDNEGTHIIIRDPGGNEIYLDTQGKNITISAPETMTFNCKNMNINVEENMNTSVGENNLQTIGMNNSVAVGSNNSLAVGMMNDLIVGGDNMTLVTGKFTEMIEGDLISETKKGRSEISEMGIEISSNDSIAKHAQNEVRNNSGGKSKAN